MKKNVLIIICVFIALMPIFSSGAQETYPNSAVNIIVPASAGGDTDSYARLFAQYMEKELGVSVNVTNYQGAAGLAEGYSTAPDGYNVMFFHASSMISNITGALDYQTLEMTIASVPVQDKTSVLVAPAKRFANTEDFVAKAKAGEEIIASIATGTYAQLGCLQFVEAIDAENVKYVISTNAADRITDMLAGRIDLFFTQYGVVKQYVENGDFIVLGLLAEERNSFFPDIPTFKEQGYDDILMNKIFYFAFPPKTDASIVTVFNNALEKAIANPECKEAFAVYCVEPEFNNAEESVKIMTDAYNSYKKYEDYLR